MNKLVSVVIPVYKETIAANETRSLQTCLDILSRYPITLVASKDLNINQYKNLNQDIRVEYFDSTYFEGIKGYNKLLLSEEFYERFRSFKYILIYQLDALVFYDNLEYWCNKNYDYIGAPWINTGLNIFLNIFWKQSVWKALKLFLKNKLRICVGNGGLSLRKTETFIQIASEKAVLLYKWKTNEDYFWSFFAKRSNKSILKPSPKEAANFSIETKPEKAYRLLNQKMPFGTHAWEKSNSIFWKTKITSLLHAKQNTIELFNPKISIITVTFNCGDLLQRTINSIKAQTWSNIEHIIIDAGSTDNTIEIIKRNEKYISKWISEPDNGIYDAMNKGLQYSTGDYVWFINAGDEIYKPTTLKDILENYQSADVYYGETMIVNSQRKEVGLRRLKPIKPLTWRSFQWGQLISHQAFIAKKELSSFYNLKYKHSADTDWQIGVLKKSNVVVNTNQILCNFLDGGKSKQTIIPSLFERFDIMIKNYGLIKTILNHIIITFRFLFYIIRHRRF